MLQGISYLLVQLHRQIFLLDYQVDYQADYQADSLVGFPQTSRVGAVGGITKILLVTAFVNQPDPDFLVGLHVVKMVTTEIIVKLLVLKFLNMQQKFQFQSLDVTKTLDYQPMANAYL